MSSLPSDAESTVPRGVRFLVVVPQLLLILAIVYLFDIEGRRYFFPVMCLAVAGFLIHAWLPARYRLAFFTLLSLAGIMLFLGWPNGGLVLGIGGALIAICYLPIPWIGRVLMLAVATLVLVMQRVEFPAPFWPVLGSMFMFRLIVYLYDLRHLNDRPPLLHTLAYFFMLPNVCFTLFPVIDFKTFRATYREHDPHLGYQTGIEYLVRGLSHLLAYRFIKYYLLPAPHEIRDLPHFALFLATNYALYLHISGQFHVITGMLYLFGFNLPRTHLNYFLASSFSDIWRRINIYWKDFMSKVFFFPAFLTLRPLGTRLALALATGWVFLCTWLLHAYQVFWLRGDLPLAGPEAGLWLLAGAVVAVRLQRDLTRAARPAPREMTLWSAAEYSAGVVGMFLLVSVFWACWNTPAFPVYVRAQLQANRLTLAGGARVLAILLVAVGVGVFVQLARARLTRLRLLPLRFSPTASALGLTAGLVAVALVGTPQMAALFGARAASVIASLRRQSATVVEASQVVQGYYEEITNVRVPTGAWLSALEGRPPPPSSTNYAVMTRVSDDLLQRELIPGWSGEVEGRRLTINRFGMRDRPDRSPKKPAGVCRIAVVGSSVVMGYGVGDDETFTRLLENRLNTSRKEGEPRYEVLNFGTGQSSAIQRRALIDRKVFDFEPDGIYYIAHQNEFLASVEHLARLAARGGELHLPCLKDVVRKAGIAPDATWGIANALLQPFARDIVLGIYRDLIDECRRRGILAVWVYLPIPGVVDTPVQAALFTGPAQEAGFRVVNLSDWESRHRPGEVKLGEDDPHLNALGHRLIAERLDAVLRQRPELLPVSTRGGP